MVRELAEKYPQASYRDLLHLAVIIDNGVKNIYTTDKAFSVFEEVQSFSPLDFK